MENNELQMLVEELSINFFNRSFKHKATFNARLRTTGGRYLLRSHHLEFNPKQLDHFGIDEFKKIIKHELCHYHLHTQGKGYKHKDKEFKALLKQVGGSRYCQRIPGTENTTTIKYIYRCKECGQSYPRKKRINTSRYVCGKCKGKLQLTKDHVLLKNK